jgi:hypothetical protein
MPPGTAETDGCAASQLRLADEHSRFEGYKQVGHKRGEGLDHERPLSTAGTKGTKRHKVFEYENNTKGEGLIPEEISGRREGGEGQMRTGGL